MTSREPFEEGNDAAEVHGAFSRARLDPVEASLLDRILDEQPHLGLASFRSALEAYVRAEARVIVLHSWLDENGLIGPDDEPRAAAELVLRCESQAAKARERVGLDPHSYAEIRAIASAAGFGDPNDLDPDDELARGRAHAVSLLPTSEGGTYEPPPPVPPPIPPRPRRSPPAPPGGPEIIDDDEVERAEPERRPERLLPARSVLATLDDLRWRGPRRGR